MTFLPTKRLNHKGKVWRKLNSAFSPTCVTSADPTKNFITQTQSICFDSVGLTPVRASKKFHFCRAHKCKKEGATAHHTCSNNQELQALFGLRWWGTWVSTQFPCLYFQICFDEQIKLIMSLVGTRLWIDERRGFCSKKKNEREVKCARRCATHSYHLWSTKSARGGKCDNRPHMLWINGYEPPLIIYARRRMTILIHALSHTANLPGRSTRGFGILMTLQFLRSG